MQLLLESLLLLPPRQLDAVADLRGGDHAYDALGRLNRGILSWKFDLRILKINLVPWPLVDHELNFLQQFGPLVPFLEGGYQVSADDEVELDSRILALEFLHQVVRGY